MEACESQDDDRGLHAMIGESLLGSICCNRLPRLLAGAHKYSVRQTEHPRIFVFQAGLDGTGETEGTNVQDTEAGVFGGVQGPAVKRKNSGASIT
jgi:hypothetical protein